MAETREWTDNDNDTLMATTYRDGEPCLSVNGHAVILTASDVRELVAFLLGEETCAATVGPVPKLGGQAFACEKPTHDDTEHEGQGAVWHDVQPDAEAQSVLEEAQSAIYGDREADYGSPRDNWTRTAILWTGLLQHKLADGEYISPEDGLRCMVAVKLARDVNSPKRDNRVDGAGYLALLDRLETGK